jgi:transcriptional regulator with XRE-family HTH domain
MTNREKLGWFVKVAREQRGLTQARLASRIRTKQESVSRAEKHGCSLAFAEKAVGSCGYRISNISLRATGQYKSGISFLSSI